MVILKPMLAIAAMLSTAQSLTVPPADKTVSDPTPVLEARWQETNCVPSDRYDTGDYGDALSQMISYLTPGPWLNPITLTRKASGAAQVYICNNEKYHDVQVYYGFFNSSMSVLDAVCGAGVPGWVREHVHDVDVSMGRNSYPNEECGF